MANTTFDPRLTVLQKLWHESSFTQDKAALSFGVSQSAINQYLKGKIPLNTDIIIKFSKLLNAPAVSIDPNLTF